MTDFEQKKNDDPLDVHLAIRLEILAGIRVNIGSPSGSSFRPPQIHGMGVTRPGEKTDVPKGVGFGTYRPIAWNPIAHSIQTDDWLLPRYVGYSGEEGDFT